MTAGAPPVSVPPQSSLALRDATSSHTLSTAIRRSALAALRSAWLAASAAWTHRSQVASQASVSSADGYGGSSPTLSEAVICALSASALEPSRLVVMESSSASSLHSLRTDELCTFDTKSAALRSEARSRLSLPWAWCAQERARDAPANSAAEQRCRSIAHGSASYSNVPQEEAFGSTSKADKIRGLRRRMSWQNVFASKRSTAPRLRSEEMNDFFWA